MVKPPTKPSGTPPTHFAPSVPDPSAANPFVFTQMMELTAAFARVEQKIDTLKERVDKLDGSVNAMEHAVSKVRGGVIVAGIVFTLALALVGWMVAGDVKVTMGGGDKPASAAAPPAPPVASQPKLEPAPPGG